VSSLFRLLCQHFRSAEPVAAEIDGLDLRLADGQLYLAADDPRTHALEVGEDSSLDERLRALARELAGRRVETFDQSAARERLDDEAGPYQAAFLVAELAVLGVRPGRLEARLGGQNALLHSVMPTVAIKLPLGQDSIRLVDRLSQPTRLSDLLRAVAKTQRKEVLCQLAVLHALGLVQCSDDSSAATSTDPLTARLSERIAERLAAEPPTTSPEAQRQEIAELWQRQGELDHYQLLEVPRQAAAMAVTQAFDRLALLAHPSNAAHLGLPADDAMLATLFDRAVEAYRTLIDPDLRVAYNRIALPESTAAEVVGEARENEKQVLASENVQRALFHLQQQDVSIAVDLLKEAARLAPNADTWATLARAQARNPGWRRHAVQSWREAIALQPQWTEAYTALAETLEAMGDEQGASEQLRKALELAPNDGNIQAALGRLGTSASPAAGKRGGWLHRRKSGADDV
jgi:tetratricopeptide (TPR) repeat protein